MRNHSQNIVNLCSELKNKIKFILNSFKLGVKIELKFSASLVLKKKCYFFKVYLINISLFEKKIIFFLTKTKKKQIYETKKNLKKKQKISP